MRSRSRSAIPGYRALVWTWAPPREPPLAVGYSGGATSEWRRRMRIGGDRQKPALRVLGVITLGRVAVDSVESGDRMLSPRSQQALFTLPAFRNLGEAERKQVAGFFHEIAVEKDALIYRAGDDADALYLVASGAVDVLDGEEVVARYGPGEIF